MNFRLVKPERFGMVDFKALEAVGKPLTESEGR
jgi:hypothetical protein